MNQKLEEIIATAHLNDLLQKKSEEEKKTNVLVWVFAIVGVVAAIVAIVIAVVKYLTPSYLDDDFDDFDDDFDDDFYTDDDFGNNDTNA